MCLCFRILKTVVPSILARFSNEFREFLTNGCGVKKVDNYYDYPAENCLIEDNKLSTELIKTELYYKAIDRNSAEDILRNRIDGSCLIRPYKEESDCIKYVLTVYAANNFFHLLIRKHCNGTYSVGQEKQSEKHFNSPKDIINYYRLHKLICTNKTTMVNIVLVPIT